MWQIVAPGLAIVPIVVRKDFREVFYYRHAHRYYHPILNNPYSRCQMDELVHIKFLAIGPSLQKRVGAEGADGLR